MDEAQVRQVAFVQGDVTDRPAQGYPGDASDHARRPSGGLQVPTCRADPLLGAKVNVLGTLAVFEAVTPVASAGPAAGLRQFRRGFAARRSNIRAGPLADDVPSTPTTHYGFFKCCNEGNARIYFQDYGLSSIGLRPWTVYGVGRDFGMTSEPTKAIKSLALGRAYHITYGGWQDLQYVDDVGRDRRALPGAPYRGEVVQPARPRGGSADVSPGAVRGRSGGGEARSRSATANRHRLRSRRRGLAARLGPMPRTPLTEGIRRTLELFRELRARGGWIRRIWIRCEDCETARGGE